jgi:RNA polymerase sigma factor (sigma-70 family)
MMNTPTMLTATPSDADLVQNSLTGGSAAFAEIVARYQTLVCSLTYNATGSLSRSEDLAQEVFLTAWKDLRRLREPAKLRPWLCGIARRLTANTRRREGREPACGAGELEDEHHAVGPGPVEQTISREEEAILWRSLAQMPETYREPLILFYREGQSVEHVAAALELTEDTARQRLSRGRKLLQVQVALFVEGALRQSTPGRAFTLGVITALPLMTVSATAATIGTAAAKSGVTASGASVLGVLSVLLGPAIGLLGAWFGVKMSLEFAESEAERALIRRQTRWVLTLVLGFLVALGVAMPLAAKIWQGHRTAAIALIVAPSMLYAIGMFTMAMKFRRAHRRVQAEQAIQRGPAAAARFAEVWKTFEYKSSWTLLGLPLVHVRSGRPHGEKLRPAVGWIAIGDLAFGLVAVGGMAVGGISCGGLSAGLLAVGGVSLGGLAFGGLALGIAAVGGLAIGYLAHGGCALAWHAAQGGLVVARDFALGGGAQAAHANDALAREVIGAHGFFRRADAVLRNPWWVSVVWLPLLLLPWQIRRARRALKRNSAL